MKVSIEKPASTSISYSFAKKEQPKSLFFQPRLALGPVNDAYEREADSVAEKIVKTDNAEQIQTKITPVSPRAIQREEEENLQGGEQYKLLPETPESSFLKQSLNTPLIGGYIQRACPQCAKEEEEKIQRKTDHPSLSTEVPESVYEAIKSPSRPMEEGTRTFMESRFGYDLGNVKIHTGNIAAKSAQDVNALAYTSGNSIVFNQGQYTPHTESGKKLLAHELTHVIQQKGSSGTIQRTVHGSNTPRTPTNCHNWKIPLPPWIAGTMAHSQIAAFAAGAGIVPHLIPRATKILRGIPNPPFGTPPGYADLWWNTGADVRVAEIKSTAAGDAAAHPEARHYRDRHNEWLARLAMPPHAFDDAAYLASVGAPLPGSLLDLSGFTGTDLSLGPFIGDPLKQLHIEADSNGAMVYWCTGFGMVNPIWVVVLRDLLDKLRDLLDQLKRLMQRIGQGIRDALGWLGENAPVIAFVLLVIALLALLVLAIVCLIAAPETGGLSLACSYLGVIGAIEAFAAILIVLGFSEAASDVREAGSELAMTRVTEEESAQLATAEAYERLADRGPASTTTSTGGTRSSGGDPAARLVAALRPLMSFDGVMTLARNATTVPPGTQSALNQALAVLDRAGDSSTSALIRSEMSRLS